ncbi:hypothetical protein [Bacillus sp. EB01]|uniref:hypothetical protein n=1 Tax=Bacillus sp. EB01 TaxID=1347086 RepID=UPI0005C5EA13|nr:hypothetical protein [Bacillus sp. EB01]
MKRLKFERPTDYYDERLLEIDEQLCSLLKQRKEISSNNPGFPELEVLAKWAEKYSLYEELLYGIFGSLLNDEFLRPIVEPVDFQKNIHVLRSLEIDQILYTVPFIKQYANATVVHFMVDKELEEDVSFEERYKRESFWELSAGEGYECRLSRSGGNDGHMNHKFVVTPPLPDDVSGLKLVFIECQAPFKKNPTGLEVVFHLK